MGEKWNGGRHDPSESDAPGADELERQAREALAQIRSRFGELGGRVRRVVERAGAHWEAAAPVAPAATSLGRSAGDRARALARRWADIDFLVDPELSIGLAVHGLEDAAQWRIEVRERGETRTLEERTAPYRGAEPAEAQPVRPLWDYDFPLTPEIDAGERRERLPGTGSVRACDTCGGTGQRTCHACEGRGRDTCPRCRGHARLACARCHGRGVIPRTRSSAPGIQAHAERLAAEAGERVVDLAEHLRQDWGVPLPPTHEWTPPAMMPRETVPCPGCEGRGTVPCDCGTGERVCAHCEGTGHEDCPICKGGGRLVHHREIVRRFDTRLATRTLPMDAHSASWVPADVMARGTGEPVWSGGADRALAVEPPAEVPADVWKEALAFAHIAVPAAQSAQAGSDVDRRVISRRLLILRVPLTRLEYEFAERQYVVVAFGVEGAERFWAETFPHRWSRVSRFLRAITRDLGEVPPSGANGQGEAQISALDDYRARKSDQQPPDDASRPASGDLPRNVPVKPDGE
ncbi:MAG TPA: hypothetical protein VF818_13270 [Ktedonobacterales bacterium]